MNRLLLSIIIILIIIRPFKTQTCENGMTININNNCFNEIILFNNKNYRSGHFAINNKGDMIVEYSDERSRLFYGLKKNVRYFFDTDNNRKEIENIQNPS